MLRRSQLYNSIRLLSITHCVIRIYIFYFDEIIKYDGFSIYIYIYIYIPIYIYIYPYTSVINLFPRETQNILTATPSIVSENFTEFSH